MHFCIGCGGPTGCDACKCVAAEEAAVGTIFLVELQLTLRMPRRWQSRITVAVTQPWHVRRFLLVAADVRDEVEFLEAVQDNVAAVE